MLTRRQFIKLSSLAGAGMLMPVQLDLIGSLARAATPGLTRWVDPLPIPAALKPDRDIHAGMDYYRIAMTQFSQQLHSDLPPTPLWGYGGSFPGPTIEARVGRPVRVTWENRLPTTHLLADAIDPTIFHRPYPDVRAVTHLHGGFTPPQFDGGPEAWATPGNTQTGPAYTPGDYIYPNDQQACTLWYHDHAMGITRLNVYAGLAAFYLLRDDDNDHEDDDSSDDDSSDDTSADHLRADGADGDDDDYDASAEDDGERKKKDKDKDKHKKKKNRVAKDEYEIPIVIQDRAFNADGSLFYPATGVSPRHPIWVPEFFGDTPVVNGKAYPYLDVEPRRYRFRFLNGSQARFYNIWFDDGGLQHPFHMIGSDGGLLPQAVPLNQILLGPAERCDMIVDFSGLAPGTVLTLKNDANSPYPDGDPANITDIMQFRVNLPLKKKDKTTPPAELKLPPLPLLTPTPGAPQREIILKEVMDPVTDTPTEVLLNGRFFDEPVDENPRAGDTEIWQFLNLTVDAHPMHLHLVQFQILNRQPFDAAAYSDAWLAYMQGAGPRPLLDEYLAGPPRPPTPEEAGWKDTAIALPGEVLRIIATFDIPEYTQLPADYVYHCHILEHEDNEMMRPFTVV